ncbi:MAG TPA: hypothetical protein VKV20_19720 [Ktedonobacteraceae bacterium]|nr:hypothetical protein [Ktedonobacteraceae bacterium]
MKSINECIGEELQWVHPHLLRAEYELRAGDEVLVSLSYSGAFSSQARAEAADGLWVFERKNLSRTITVLALDTRTELASVKRGMSGHSTLLFPDGREYRWQCSSFWHTVWTWFDQEGRPLLHLKRGKHVQLEPDACDLHDLALLTTLGWYLYKQQEEEAATAAAIVPVIS